MGICSFIVLVAFFVISNLEQCSGAHLFQHRKLAALVTEPPLILSYHNGPLLAGSGALTVHLLWYGSFNSAQKNTVTDFFRSFVPDNDKQGLSSSVSSWWKTTASYKDAFGVSILSSVELGAQTSDAAYSIGKNLKRSDLEILVVKIAQNSKLLEDSKSLYLVLTSEDVYVDGFCTDACASHSKTSASTAEGDHKVVYVWVGNSASTCPGKCAWPFANPKSFGGPDTPALIAPNGDVGVDGMIINIATVLAGAATNPFGSGYFQGDVNAPLEAATACAGIFGEGAFPGFAGKLLVDSSTKASFNVRGINGRTFLLPALWNPSTLSCSSPS
ncbi:hypothetical protein O6H91_07G122000 [Diphasiastrum complanatum]|uniref:Uncharacterized protein n=2 Tax=Diphasiastrum complanatum TaxID=34168 RepID=A0ACC2D964_DIPCM|nr:hypothetical protein O6H91_07G114600 [Diphasiastrum complanatum]KAJ7550861.1 hypothetical protein O6H91_07G122000 [Diphasiastrum complanatum]